MNAFERRDSNKFKFALCNLNADVSAELKRYDGLTIFEKALLTPGSSDFIEMCIVFEAELYSVRYFCEKLL